MENLRAVDLRNLLVQVRRLNDNPSLDTFPAKALACVRGLVASDWAAYEELNLPKNRIVGATDPIEARPGKEQLDVFMEHLDEHPVIERFAGSDDRRARTISDFLPRSEYYRTGIYNEFYKAMGTEDQLGIFVDAPKPLTIVLGVSRTRRSFTDRERTLFDVLQPHLLQAYRNAEAVSVLPRDGRWAIDALHATDQGVVSLTSDRRVQDITPQARRWLTEYFPRASQDKVTSPTLILPDAIRRWVDRSTHAHHTDVTTDDVPTVTATFAVPQAGATLRIRIVRVHEGNGYLLIMTEHRHDVSYESDARFARLAPRYRRVLCELLAGRSEKETASGLSLSRHTVHEYVKEIYQTFSVGSRGELLSLWLEER